MMPVCLSLALAIRLLTLRCTSFEGDRDKGSLLNVEGGLARETTEAEIRGVPLAIDPSTIGETDRGGEAGRVERSVIAGRGGTK